MLQRSSHRVLIAGGGVAGLEALTALRALAGDRVDVTLVDPDPDFSLRALSVGDAFGRPRARRYHLGDLCRVCGATYRCDALTAVHREARTVSLASGSEPGYDSLLAAVGARPRPVFDGVTTFRGGQDAEGVHGLVQDVEGGWTRRVAFVVPPGVAWPLPLYELALMLAERASSLSLDVSIVLVTPEERPLAMFGGAASAAVDEALRRAGIVAYPSIDVTDVRSGELFTASGRRLLRADRVVALPRLAASRIAGLPTDGGGFVPVDEHGRVRGADAVFAAGDGTSSPIKHGGLAAQQADAAARSIALRAGADVAATPFRPTLRAELLAGTRSIFLRHALDRAGVEPGAVTHAATRWPPSKVAAPHLTEALARFDRDGLSARCGAHPVTIGSAVAPAAGRGVGG